MEKYINMFGGCVYVTQASPAWAHWPLESKQAAIREEKRGTTYM
jgi:hypothetical protein